MTLLIFDPLQRIARLFGSHPHEIVVGMLQSTLVMTFRICGLRLHVERSAAVKPRTPYIFISNHQSIFDIPIIGALLFTNYPKYVSKQSLAKWIPSISYNLRRGGNALIDRGNREAAQKVIAEMGKLSQQRGVSPVIFPEGTRARRGVPAPFKPAGTLTLLQAAPQLPVVPVTIDNSWRLLSHNLFPVPFGIRIRVNISSPIQRSAFSDEQIFERVKAEIEATLERWREKT